MIVAVIVTVCIAIDRALARDPGTYHHARSPLVIVPALLLAAYLWHARARFSKTGQVGLSLCAGGAAANLVCLLLDHAGVSDYIDLRVGHYMIVLNTADIALLSGAAIVACSMLAGRLGSHRGVPAQ